MKGIDRGYVVYGISRVIHRVLRLGIGQRAGLDLSLCTYLDALLLCYVLLRTILCSTLVLRSWVAPREDRNRLQPCPAPFITGTLFLSGFQPVPAMLLALFW